MKKYAVGLLLLAIFPVAIIAWLVGLWTALICGAYLHGYRIANDWANDE
jgi:hypothetical protein